MTIHGESKKQVLRRFDEDGVVYTEPTPAAIYYYAPHVQAREIEPLTVKALCPTQR